MFVGALYWINFSSHSIEYFDLIGWFIRLADESSLCGIFNKLFEQVTFY